uniref:non-muscle caldesmon-like isoform X1 n=1 Tax=Oncorhynchus gorbuscha TaxID=8017 RepID=UPI001EAEFCC3|nr:non-muscle caldesmon-like isoform X1 [Oncorhynchus gorbuscha]XP_046210819.1 non-muscle caldesmon-like isoform X1 [Oncorhynchus gorbuscha]XP_046210820.1 non-muscle caldesmon-like isoform X1 [Oncorhynchus gorbuscha]XP_046210821.1 non-muscle caldesmon-like isoform X1 [Oncorhynchus gorbuscha]
MSRAIPRRNTSKQGLQNLLKITTQRSVEDAEEVERERRRRARESYRSMGSSSTSDPGGLSLDNVVLAEDGLYESDLKPSSSSPSMEEDEGFSDWTQRLERRRQQAQRMEELSQAPEEQDQRPLNGAAKAPTPHTLSASATPTTSTSRLQRQHKAEAEDEEEKKLFQLKEKRKDVKVSYTSQVILQTEAKHANTNGDTAGEEITSYMAKTKLRAPRAVVQVAGVETEEEAEAILEAKLVKIRRSQAEKENQELELLRHKQAEAEQDLEELKRRREERRQVREGEERRSREEEQQRLAKEEEEKRRMKEDIERRRMEAAERMKSLSTSSVDGDELFSPLNPKGSIYKITERTESLNRSLKKSNSFKKTQPPVLLAKIDDRLEQYTHAIEYSQEAKAAKQGLMDIPMSPEAVSSKKHLFEAGEAWNQSPSKGTPSKNAEGLKVGVADLITQWVKGNPDGTSRNSPPRPADVKAGDVMQKKNMWEIIGETSPGRLGAKGNPSGKRYKFVMTAHGKYAKIPVDDDEYMDEYTNGKADLPHGEY